VEPETAACPASTSGHSLGKQIYGNLVWQRFKLLLFILHFLLKVQAGLCFDIFVLICLHNSTFSVKGCGAMGQWAKLPHFLK